MQWSPDIPLYGGARFSPGVPDPDNVTIIDHGALPMIHAFHKHGIRVDIPYLNNLSAQIDDIKARAEDTVLSGIGAYQYTHPKTGVRTPFSIGSRDHLSQLLFEELKVQGNAPIPRTDSDSRYGVSEEILQPYKKDNPIVAAVIEWHSANKIQSTYCIPLPRWADSDSRIHTKFNPTQAATGRLASSKPNLQNIPTRTALGKLVRAAFISSPGWVLVSSDYAQIEMVWAAHRSQDPTMLGIFQRGEDMHNRTTCNVFKLDYEKVSKQVADVEAGTADAETLKWYKHFKQFMRLPCKTVGFGILYGQTPEGLQASLASDGVFWTIDECTVFMEKTFFSVYPGLKVMLDADYRFVQRYGMSCDDFGRCRLVPEAKSTITYRRSEGIRKAGNHPEQSSAQCTIKIAMARLMPIVDDFGPDQIRPLLQIHDQLIMEVRKEIAEEYGYIQASEMEVATPLTVPTRCSSDIAERCSEL